MTYCDMTLLTVVLSAVFFLALGFAYCLGWNYVRKNFPGHLVHYYLFSAVFRFLLVASIVLAYIRLSDASRGELVTFAAMFLGMYVAMMVITLCLKHK